VGLRRVIGNIIIILGIIGLVINGILFIFGLTILSVLLPTESLQAGEVAFGTFETALAFIGNLIWIGIGLLIRGKKSEVFI